MTATPSNEMSATNHEPEMLAHRIASEVARRENRGIKPLGRDSIYNIVREVAAEILSEASTPTAGP